MPLLLKKICTILLLGCCLPLLAQDNVIFDQTCCLGGAQSGCSFIDTNFDLECSDADDFNVPVTTTIRRLEIQGFYDGALNDQNHSGVIVRVWSDVDTAPEDVVYERTFNDAVSVDGSGDFDLDVNINLTAGVYWLQVTVDATGIQGGWAPNFSTVESNFRGTRAFRGTETLGEWFVTTDTSGLLFRLSGEASGPPPPPNRLVPHITAAGGGFDSRLIVTNLTSTNQTFTLSAYDTDGNPLDDFSDSIATGRTQFYEIEDMFGSLPVSHMFLDNVDQVTVAAEYRANFIGAGTAHVPISDRRATSWQLYPGNTAVTWDGFAVVNTGNEPTDVIVTQRAANGTPIQSRTAVDNLPTLAKGLYVISGQFNDQPGSYFEISADQPLALTALRGSQTSDFLWENNSVTFDDTMRTAAHITPNGDFQTRVILSNPENFQQTVQLEASDMGGLDLGLFEVDLLANETAFLTTDELFGGSAVSHFDIAAGTQVGVTLAYQANKDVSGPAHVGISSQTADIWRIYPGNPDVTWDGLAIVNRGSAPTDVLIVQRDQAGFVVNDVLAITDLQPNAKGLFVISGALPVGVNTYYEISTSQPTSITALRGNLASDFFWENFAIPVP